MQLRTRTVTLALALIGAAAHAATIHVEMTGIDGGDCGSSAAPCRTIAQGIAKASPRDVVEVGPGRYGDLNRNGTLGDPGEEPAGSTVVRIDKPITVRSRRGADHTLIDGGGWAITGVSVSARGAAFGTRRRGFTVVGVDGSAIGIKGVGSGPGVKVESNVATMNPGVGFDVVTGDGHVLRDNAALANGSAGFLLRSGTHDHVLTRNRAIANGFDGGGHSGFIVFGDRVELSGNEAAGNGSKGFHLIGADLRVLRNTARGNVAEGMFVEGAGSLITLNSFVGNVRFGVLLSTGAQVTLTKNNFYGNNPGLNCGLINDTGLHIDVPDNYWGAETGPGAEPADLTCITAGSTTTRNPFARKPFGGG